jgi:hypothetical protein
MIARLVEFALIQRVLVFILTLLVSGLYAFLVLYIPIKFSVRSHDLESTVLVAAGHDLRTAILKGAESRMRPVLMTTLAAAIGLLPAAVATGIGSQSQQPLARVVVGGMLTSAVLILVVLPVLYSLLHGGRGGGRVTAERVTR